jgi:hypothetical protein
MLHQLQDTPTGAQTCVDSRCHFLGSTNCNYDNIIQLQKCIDIFQTQKRATMNTPPNDMRWDHDRSVPHTSATSSGSAPTKTYPSGFTLPDKPTSSHISIASTTPSSPAPEQSTIVPTMKRRALGSPNLDDDPLSKSSGKRRAVEAARPPLIIHEGVTYPSATTVLVELNKVFPVHSYLDYEDKLAFHAIYYTPDVATNTVEWYISELGMGKTAATHFCDHAATLTAHASCAN